MVSLADTPTPRGSTRVGVVLLVAVPAVVAGAALATVRYRHFFPSMVDDWAAIATTPDQLWEFLTGGGPEERRYRPGLVLWSLVQWRTFGGPAEFTAAIGWNVVRLATFAAGIAALTLLLTNLQRGRWADAVRLAVAALVPLTLVTVPGFAVDLTRFETQEPLLIGGMAGGAVLIVAAVSATLDRRASRRHVIGVVAGLMLWWFGVLQKETSLAVLAMVPFLWPTFRSERRRLAEVSRRGRLALTATAVLVALPLAVMLGWTTRIVLSGKLVYDTEVDAGAGLLAALRTQASLAQQVLGSPVGVVLAGAVAIGAATLLVVERRLDWLSLGLVATSLAFLVFAAESGLVVSRYYLPTMACLAVAAARAASMLRWAAPVLAATLAALTITQLGEADRWTEEWATADRTRTALVQAAASLRAAGCEVQVTGRNVEFVSALSVLMPLARESGGDCRRGERFLVVIDGETAETTTEADPILAACLPTTEVATFDKPTATSTPLATIFRCGA